MAERHVAEGERHIVQQEQLLSSLRINGLPTAKAEKFLGLLYETQVEHRKHLEAIAAAIEGAANG